MPRALWNDAVLAETDAPVTVEGNVYFPPASLKREYFRDSDHTSVCGWKGVANYYHVTVKGKENANAAWVYRDPKPDAAHIKGYVAFWKGVRVEA